MNGQAIRPVNIVDCVTVFTDENQERIDELLDQLTESIGLPRKPVKPEMSRTELESK